MNKILFLLLTCITLTACSNSSNAGIFHQEADIPPGDSFYKEFVLEENSSVIVEASTKKKEKFDFNIFEYDSYQTYEETNNVSDLVFVHKSLDNETLKKSIDMAPGRYIFGWENYENPGILHLDITVEVSDKLTIK